MTDPRQNNQPSRPNPERLKEIAERVRHVCMHGSYTRVDGTEIDLQPFLRASREGVRLIRPTDWQTIEMEVRPHPRQTGAPRPVILTDETTLAAIRRMVVIQGLPSVAALNFASARNPGGGWDRGAVAQEESLARASGLVPTLDTCPDYYQENRRQESLLYTDHAIWSPDVPIFANDRGEWEDQAYQAGFITMPAPNAGAMTREQDLLALIPTFRSRIRKVLALAVHVRCRHLILGAWGCGAFGNDPELVAGLFADALDADQEPWRSRLDTITFAVFDSGRTRKVFRAFQDVFSARRIL